MGPGVPSDATPDFLTSPPLIVGNPFILRSYTPFHVFASDALPSPDDIELHSMTDAAAELLISHTRAFPDDARDHYHHDEDEVDEDEVDESKLVSPGLFIWSLTICAGVSGLLFGFEYVSQPCALCATSSHVASNELTTTVLESYPLP
jgi:hypothetical protein